jgi:CheY-like chemotaxis protein
MDRWTEVEMDETTRILACDDDPNVLRATTRVLRSAGYDVSEAITGESCLLAIQEKRPDMLLLDVMLPDLSGIEVCRRIKIDPNLRTIFVVMLSGLTEPDNQSEGLESGADGYIVKPVTSRELLARVTAMVRIIKAERERDRLICKLQDALANIKILHGLLPICASCKKVRDDKGYWNQLEVYILEHSEAEFTHGLCPDCTKRLYEDILEKDKH